MRAQRVLLPAAVLTAVLCAAAVAAGEDAPRIPEVTTSLAGRELRVAARLSPGLPSDVRKRLASGLPTTVAWEVRLFVSRDSWWDGLKDERRYETTATYRPVPGDYAVEHRLDGRLLETVVLPAREEAESALVALPALPSFVMGAHLVGKPLVVRVRCLYGTEMALGVVPTDTKTDWREVARFLLDRAGGGAVKTPWARDNRVLLAVGRADARPRPRGDLRARPQGPGR